MQNYVSSINNWLVDSPTGSLIHLLSGEKKRLGEYQIKLLEVLLENAGRIMSREELTALVWERRVIGSNSLPNAIHALRTALEDDGKQQKIIKTLPKKGYILEAEYCTQVEKKEAEYPGESADSTDEASMLSTENDMISVSVDGDSQAEQNTVVPVEIPLYALERTEFPQQPQPQVPRKNSRIMLMVFISLLMCIVVGVVTYSLTSKHHPKMTLASRETKLFDHITIYEVKNNSEGAPDKTDMYLFSRLRDTYSHLNSQLKARNVTMTVYYHYVQQTLNYTFILKNECDQKVMMIYFYHWHSDNSALNHTIIDQTTGTLNEMATCKK
jgi:DNA-binding winged helix-turn-helix (wHTH) protein